MENRRRNPPLRKIGTGQPVADGVIKKQNPFVFRLENRPMSRHRDKRAAFVLALLLVLVFAFGQARRADADRHEATAPVQNLP
jgi:hypothetical protein